MADPAGLSPRGQIFPFTAIVGQDRMRLALELNAVNPAVGGVLIRGEKGTAKSTAVRALTRLLPEIDIVADCRYSCEPPAPGAHTTLCSDCTERVAAGETLPVGRRRMRVVELPINASEDRVVGSIDIESAIKTGKKRFEPGVLAEANRNILYVDEVNLLDDHIVDVLLDAAAMGVNIVEREGISVWHPARFILVGTMNPEEGELRPQLLDRFGLAVDVVGIRDVRERVEIVERREAWEADPEGFAATYAAAEDAEAKKIADAIQRLPSVEVPRNVLAAIAELNVSLGVDGHRADLTARKAAQALAALRGVRKVGKPEVDEVIDMVLSHRVKGPLGQRPALQLAAG
ncbi:MAG TPA: ATP-binding protein [Candidatus Dormibacteraeota bacterium]|jgi:magnesium chelatase subunit I|nr:ATP-binding protein [Candidatus Dormibacteraeota bacterium]